MAKLKLKTTHAMLDALEMMTKLLPCHDAGCLLAGEDKPLAEICMLAPHEVTSITSDNMSDGQVYFQPPTLWEPNPLGYLSALAETLNLVDIQPLPPLSKLPVYKLALYCPPEYTAHLQEIMRMAGASRIGDYEGCSFTTSGVGRFLPLAGAHPAVGKVGNWECIPEDMILTEVSGAELGWVLAALHVAHPYEEPVIDYWQLTGRSATVGVGLYGRWSRKQNAEGEPLVGEKVALCYDREGVKTVDLHRLGIKWVIYPADQTPQEQVDGISYMGISPEHFYKPGLMVWQTRIKWLRGLSD